MKELFKSKFTVLCKLIKYSFTKTLKLLKLIASQICKCLTSHVISLFIIYSFQFINSFMDKSSVL